MRRPHPRRTPGAVALVLLLVAAACGPKRLELPPPMAAAKYPDFVFPAVMAGLGTPAAQERHHAGWLWLQAGDLRAAERNFQAALKLSADFYPAEAGLGYVGLARNAMNEAVSNFDRAVVANPRYASALVGRGEALLALGERDMALKSFEAAVGADPTLEPLRTRIEVLRVRMQQDDVATARKASEAGRYGEARVAYERAIAASPESPFLYRELAGVLRQEGTLDEALKQAIRVIELEPTDARGHVLLGDIHEMRQDQPNALAAYEAALAIERTEALARKVDALRDALALAALPAEFQQIASSEDLSREQLAALVGVRLDPLLKLVGRRAAVVITDTRGSWAGPWILAVTRAGVMEVYPNHTFQPEALVRRGELADAASRVLSLIAAQNPTLASSWRGGKRTFVDVPQAHLSYSAASLSVEAGVMAPLADGTFQLGRPVTGAEAVAAIKKLEELAESVTR
jgi:tetratricopeptide (TPR) repeat protein